ncbi:hypothetical protein LSH36_146g05015 [Paralvinella palmiformis]|uniref:G-protein coupled receptors family 1 profile domain-containing protein n=1 Tax=Paralvinella palmiformis TaxID=53620 RepID=A0AAD9N7K4_9ANNE|nr:hypothetical protein LSH36_146g05015 [Paralvinella palmiformis]
MEGFTVRTTVGDDNNNSTAVLELGNISHIGNSSGAAPSDLKCLVFQLILYGIVMGALCVVGFVGNTISFLVLQKDRSTPVASFLLQSLAVADNIFLLLWLINYSVKYIVRFLEYSSTTWIYLLVHAFPIMYMAQTQTIWLTVVIALNRFMAVCMPYRAPHLCNINNVYKEVSLVTVFSIAYNVPRFFELAVNADDNSTLWRRTEMGSNPLYQLVYSDALYYLFSFILPLLILTVVNTRVIVVYNATRQRRQRMTSSVRRHTDNENNITLVMIMVVLIFMICQAPARVVQLVWGYKYAHCDDFRFYLIHISNTLEVLNSSVNFLIYCMFHKRFRDIMTRHFCWLPPFSSSSRRDSARYPSTEGLSLEEVQRTVSRSSKKGSSIKSTSQDQNRNGSITSWSLQWLEREQSSVTDDNLANANKAYLSDNYFMDSDKDHDVKDLFQFFHM